MPIIRISETEKNLDWIKTEENRESEQRIHASLSEEMGNSNDNDITAEDIQRAEGLLDG